MKFKLFFYFTVFLFIFSVQCFSQSYLQLSLSDDEDFSVVFDNNELSSGNVAEFDNIAAGDHYLKVIKEGPNVPAQADVVFDGKIKIPSGYDVYAVIDEYNTFNIYKKKKFGYNRYILNQDFIRRCGEKHGVKEYYNNLNDECKYKAIRPDDYKDLKGSIGNRNFESSNMDILKTAIDNNYFSSEQIRELLAFFSFEDNKLQIAKYAYKKVCDKNNFFKVYDAFNFDSSITELKNYISGK